MSNHNTALDATHEANQSQKSLFGFWVYILTDCMLFATLFAAYGVLHNNTAGGPSSRSLFDLPFVLRETLILLTSSFTTGLMTIAVVRNKAKQAIMWLAVTFALGAWFLVLELTEFRHLVHEGNSWQRSGFLSSYFTLVGTHGVHITVGLLWALCLIILIAKRGLQQHNVRRLTLFGLFWHFLDIVWIFIFSVVYLMGAL